jgi:hypothetical protein
VDRLIIHPKPNDAASVIVEYECHGLLPQKVPAGPTSQ